MPTETKPRTAAARRKGSVRTRRRAVASAADVAFARALRSVGAAFVAGNARKLTASLGRLFDSSSGREIASNAWRLVEGSTLGATRAALSRREQADAERALKTPVAAAAAITRAADGVLRPLMRALPRADRQAMLRLVVSATPRLMALAPARRRRVMGRAQDWLTGIASVLEGTVAVSRNVMDRLPVASSALLLALEHRRELDERYLKMALGTSDVQTPTYMAVALVEVRAYFAWRASEQPTFPWTKDEYDIDHRRGRAAIEVVSAAIRAYEQVVRESIALSPMDGGGARSNKTN